MLARLLNFVRCPERIDIYNIELLIGDDSSHLLTHVSSMSPSSTASNPPRTSRRQSCDRCYGQKLRCTRQGKEGACHRCLRQGVQCKCHVSINNPIAKQVSSNSQARTVCRGRGSYFLAIADENQASACLKGDLQMDPPLRRLQCRSHYLNLS